MIAPGFDAQPDTHSSTWTPNLNVLLVNLGNLDRLPRRPVDPLTRRKQVPLTYSILRQLIYKSSAHIVMSCEAFGIELNHLDPLMRKTRQPGDPISVEEGFWEFVKSFDKNLAVGVRKSKNSRVSSR